MLLGKQARGEKIKSLKAKKIKRTFFYVVANQGCFRAPTVYDREDPRVLNFVKYMYEVLNKTPFLRITTQPLQHSASFLLHQAVRKACVERSGAGVLISNHSDSVFSSMIILYSHTHTGTEQALTHRLYTTVMVCVLIHMLS